MVVSVARERDGHQHSSGSVSELDTMLGLYRERHQKPFAQFCKVLNSSGATVTIFSSFFPDCKASQFSRLISSELRSAFRPIVKRRPRKPQPFRQPKIQRSICASREDDATTFALHAVTLRRCQLQVLLSCPLLICLVNASRPDASDALSAEGLPNFKGLSTGQVVLHVSSARQDEWCKWRKEVREVSRHFAGFRVMQILDLGQRDEHTRTIMVVAKFTSYRYLRNWTESIEWKDCLEKARKSGLVVDDDNSQGKVEILASDGAVIDISGLQQSAEAQEEVVESPPKYRVFAVIYLGAVAWLVLFIYTNLIGHLTAWFGDPIFADFIFIHIFVFLAVYSTTPLLVHLGFHRWLHMPRHKSCVRDRVPLLNSLLLQLENGVALFEKAPPRPHPQVLSRLELEEGRVEALRESAFRSQDRVKSLEAALRQSVAATESIRRSVQLLAKATNNTHATDELSRSVLENLAKSEGAESFAGGLTLEGSDSSETVGEEPQSYHFNWTTSTTDFASGRGPDATCAANDQLGGGDIENAGDDVEGVSMTAIHYVRWERTQEVEEVMRFFAQTMYEYSGNDFMGLDVLTDKSGGTLKYISIFRFRTYAKMKEWMMSETRRKALCRLQPLLEKTRGRESAYQLLPATDDHSASNAPRTDTGAEADHEGASESKIEAKEKMLYFPLTKSGEGEEPWTLASCWALVKKCLDGEQSEESAGKDSASRSKGRVLRDIHGELLIPQIAGGETTVSPAVPPPLWKTWILTSVGLFIIFIILLPLAKVLEDGGLEDTYGRGTSSFSDSASSLPPFVEGGACLHILTNVPMASLCPGIVDLGVLVFGTVYFGIPFMTMVFGDWLHQYTAVEVGNIQAFAKHPVLLLTTCFRPAAESIHGSSGSSRASTIPGG
eukprot:scaffold869_cov303-Pinguiococcus_pyrenoidosus.AAC.1